MKRFINSGLSIVALIVFIFFIGCASLAVYYFVDVGDSNSKIEFYLKCAVPLGTLLAILIALFGESFREAWESIQVKIKKPDKENNFADKRPADQKYEYCHHLVVQNCTPQKPIEECQIWLKRLLFKPEDGDWKEIPFAVPRLMQWAPSDYSPEKRTFGHQQIFDLGVTVQNNEGFKLTIKQGGMFISVFKVGEKVGLVFVVTANNYHGDNEFYVEVVIHKTQKTGAITPAGVSIPKREPQWLKDANAGKVPYVTPSREPVECEIVFHQQG
jgi:hypothetical protein